MHTNNRFDSAVTQYREQMLDAIDALAKRHPFAAVTLACCAIDLLSHTLYNPDENQREDAYEKTVRKKLSGYDGDGIGQQIYWLRCGLLHEFRTGNPDCRIYLGDDATGPPYWDNNVLYVMVSHFCKAVLTAFERFFVDATQGQQRAFVDRAFIHVVDLPQVRWPNSGEGIRPSLSDAGTSFATPAASGTGFPPVSDRRFGKDMFEKKHD